MLNGTRRLVYNFFVGTVDLDRHFAIYFAGHYTTEIGFLTCLQHGPKSRSGICQSRRRRIEFDSRAAKPVIEPLVRKHNSMILDLRFQAMPAMFSAHTAQLEDVDKISVEFDRERHIHCSAPVVVNSKPLVTCFLPQNF